MKNYLVKFECQIGEYQHIDYKLFNKKKSEWGYCKEFWGISKKDELKENCFWDDWIEETNQPYETIWSEKDDGIYLVDKDWRKKYDTTR